MSKYDRYYSGVIFTEWIIIIRLRKSISWKMCGAVIVKSITCDVDLKKFHWNHRQRRNACRCTLDNVARSIEWPWLSLFKNENPCDIFTFKRPPHQILLQNHPPPYLVVECGIPNKQPVFLKFCSPYPLFSNDISDTPDTH